MRTRLIKQVFQREGYRIKAHKGLCNKRATEKGEKERRIKDYGGSCLD